MICIMCKIKFIHIIIQLTLIISMNKTTNKSISAIFKFFSTSFQAKDLTIELTKNPFKKPDFQKPVGFGTICTDHMLIIDWHNNSGWEKPKIVPFSNFKLSPMNLSLNYGLSCFEGHKAYKNKKGEVYLFRTDQNCRRFLKSMQRLALPEFDPNELESCIKEYVKVEKAWVPPQENCSLYIRPFAITLDSTLQLKPSKSARICVVSSPVGPYFPEGFKPLKFFTYPHQERGGPLSASAFKIATNYGPTINVSSKGEKMGYSQVLWIGANGDVHETGASNVFFVFKTLSGEIEIATPQLDGSILPGITRDSVLTFIREGGKYKVNERRITKVELLQALAEGRLLEAFLSGTAAAIGPIGLLEIDGIKYDVPFEKELNAGKISFELYNYLLSVQYGHVKHRFSYQIEQQHQIQGNKEKKKKIILINIQFLQCIKQNLISYKFLFFLFFGKQ